MFHGFNSFFPGFEHLIAFRCAYSHDVVAEEFVGFVSTSFYLRRDEGILGVIFFFAALDFLVTLGDFGSDAVLVVAQLAHVAEVRIY